MKLLDLLKQYPATICLIAINVVAFIISFLLIGSFNEPAWTLHLLSQGAQFNPYTLDAEWYRIFTHMFLHGSILHLLFNMYALYSVGTEIEGYAGTRKLLSVYFLSGIAAALVSLYWNLFSIGVGASGAIFGLFGFSLVINLIRSRKYGRSMAGILINFGIFMGINLLMAKALNADNSAHLGGLFCGILLTFFVIVRIRNLYQIRYDLILIPILIVVYFSLPRYQVTYFKFFQYVLATEDSARNVFGKDKPDEYYVEAFKRSNARWDTAITMLRAHQYLPKTLKVDTFKLSHYIQLRKQENTFRIKMIERESYVYYDSIQIVQEAMQNYYGLDYPLALRIEEKKEEQPKEQSDLLPVKVLYNNDWEEIPDSPFAYYRMGTRDSLGRWQGSLRDFYANGDVQMKGTYKDDERDGIFIYYSDHKTYTSAGRYKKDQSIGKWETYHNNGTLASEVYFTDRYFLKNLWDSAGNQQVTDGHGKMIVYYSNGIVSTEGEYKDGYREGYWRGMHANGNIYFEENYYRGRLISGRSRNTKGETFIYDQSSLFPLPEGGYNKLKYFLQAEARKAGAKKSGVVRLSFRVTEKGSLTDFKVVKSVSKETDELAKQILKSGPGWIAAKEHGCVPVDGFAYAEIEF